MNANIFITKDYIKNDCLAAQKNKPNSNPILSAVGGFQMNLKSLAEINNTVFALCACLLRLFMLNFN